MFVLTERGTLPIKNNFYLTSLHVTFQVVYLKNGEISVGQILICCLKLSVLLFLATLTLEIKVHFSTFVTRKVESFLKDG